MEKANEVKDTLGNPGGDSGIEVSSTSTNKGSNQIIIPFTALNYCVEENSMIYGDDQLLQSSVSVNEAAVKEFRNNISSIQGSENKGCRTENGELISTSKDNISHAI